MPITGNSRGFGQRDGSAAQWIRCGEALAAAKEQVPHGEWLPWLEANFEGNTTTADRYRLVAANSLRVGNLDTSNLSLRAVLKRIERINREEKKLPDGFLDGLVEVTGKNRAELKRRRQFAERYPTQEAIGSVLSQCRSWDSIINDALPDDAHVMSETACESCGNAFTQSGKGRPRKFCVACSPQDPRGTNAAWRARTGYLERKRQERLDARPVRQCRECAGSFPARHNQIYCSRKCAKRADNRRYRQRRAAAYQAGAR